VAEVVRRNTALSVSPLKSSQTVGASLAFLGIDRAIPMMHGSQGCTAFGKIFFVRHFREPIPLQTTAMDQVTTVMGSEASVVEGLNTLCAKARPRLIGVPTTGLSETQGSDVVMAVKQFRAKYPEHAHIAVVPVASPDYTGCLESGYATAVKELIDVLVPEAVAAGSRVGQRRSQVNVLAGASLTPGDIEALKELCEAFGLVPVVVPDLSDSLDGHLGDEDFSPITTGGTPVDCFATLGEAAATLVAGASLDKAADLLRERTGVPDHRFDHLLGLEAVDRLVDCLHRISGRPVPPRLERQRAQLQDAMLDCHFTLGQARVAIGADPDLLHGLADLVTGMGAEVVAAVVPDRAAVLARVPAAQVKIGDLHDLEGLARDGRAEVLLGNSHATETVQRLGIPMLHVGFPQYDLMGGYQRAWIGYRGSRQALFDLTNLLARHHEGVPPYRSIYRDEPEYRAAVGKVV
jgi:nitrogenase molybdenum-iron protein NifN